VAVSLPAPPWPSVGVEGLVPHALSHTMASLAIGAGANVKVVQRMLGHATAAMTLDLYRHLLDDDLTGVADALGKAIESTAVSLLNDRAESSESELLKVAN
jgi:integrase